MSEKLPDKKFKIRLIFIFFVFLFMFLLIIINLFRIQVISHKYWSKIAYNQYMHKSDLIAKRGKIISSEGFALAYDLTNYYIVLDPTQIKKYNIDKLSDVLSNVIGINSNQVKQDINYQVSVGSKYLKFKKLIHLDNKTKLQKTLYETSYLSRGVYFIKHLTRIYPRSTDFRPLLGFLNIKGTGVMGIEKYYNKYLLGHNGFSEKFMSTYIKFKLPVGKKSIYDKAKNGDNIILNVNYKLQNILDIALQTGMKKNNATWATGIIANPNNGKILAIASLPIAKNIGYTNNKAVSYQYEPGSTFKPMVVSYALQHHIITSNEIFYDPGYINLYGTTIKDADDLAEGYITIKKILTQSSNVGMVKVSLKYTKKQFYNMLDSYGFTTRTGIDTTGELLPYLEPYQDWSGLKKPTMAFGQGIAVTPIQMIMAFSAVINGGTLYKPELVNRIVSSSGKIIKQFKPVVVRKIITPEVSKEMRGYLHNVVVNGTGYAINIFGYDIGGKTGTAQISGGSKGYVKNQYNATFISFFPAYKPKYICLVLVNKPHPLYYASQVAVPIVRDIFRRIITAYNLLPTNIEENILKLGVKKKTISKINAKNIRKNKKKVLTLN